jgi:hypothetical protein
MSHLAPSYDCIMKIVSDIMICDLHNLLVSVIPILHIDEDIIISVQQSTAFSDIFLSIFS